jgi:hypothetical protein
MTKFLMKTNSYLILAFLAIAFLLPSVGANAADKPKYATDMPAGIAAPAGKKNNWVQTMPGKGFNVILRLYSPLKQWYDKTWRPSEIELVE